MIKSNIETIYNYLQITKKKQTNTTIFLQVTSNVECLETVFTDVYLAFLTIVIGARIHTFAGSLTDVICT